MHTSPMVPSLRRAAVDSPGLTPFGLADAAVTLRAVRIRHHATTPVLLLRLGSWQVERAEMEPGTFRVGHGFRDDMSTLELVDSTRAWWRIDPNRLEREGINHAVAIHQGVTRAVVRIGNLFQRSDRRRAFSATLLTNGQVFDEWVGPLGRSVDFARGNRNPVAYWTPS